MQAQGYIQSVGYDTEAFWREANLLAQNNDMDPNLAYMYLMVREAEGHLVFTKGGAGATAPEYAFSPVWRAGLSVSGFTGSVPA